MTMQIKDYETVFYLSEAQRHKEVTWCKFPVTRRSEQYEKLMRMPARKGHTAYTVFLALVAKVSRAKTKGVLRIDGQDLTPADAASACFISVRMAEEAWHTLTEIGWLEPINSEQSETVQQTADKQSVNVLEKRRGEERREDPPAPPRNSAPRGGDGGEGSPLTASQEAARRALVALGVRYDTARSEVAKLADGSAEAIVAEAVRLGRRSPDRAPDPALIVSELRSGNAAEAFAERSARDAGVMARADELVAWVATGEADALDWLSRSGLRADDAKGIRGAMVAQARREAARQTAGVRS